MNKKTKNQIISILNTGIIMIIGLIILKYIPMKIWGNDILFDASMHITVACFVLHIIWFFIDQNKKWQIPFFMFCLLVLAIISFQRIYVNAHNDIGLLGGLSLSIFAIWYPQYSNLKKKIHF